MIVSHYLSEPEAHDHVSTPHAGSESFTRLSKVWRVIRRVRSLLVPSFRAGPGPFQRLDFWTASHPLSYKLRLYQVTEPRPSIFRGVSWGTLKYWELLLTSFEVTPWQMPPESGEDIPRLDESRIPDADRLVHAEPFSDPR